MNIVDELRRRAGLTQDLLAKPPGVSATSISRYERDCRSPTLTTLSRLAATAGFEAIVSFAPIEPAEERRAFVCRLDGDAIQGSRWSRRRPDAPRAYGLHCRFPIVSMTSFGAM